MCALGCIQKLEEVWIIAADSRQWLGGLCSRWWKENRRLERLLRATDVDSFTLGYEELALAPQQVFEHLFIWLGVSFDDAMLRPGSCSRSHEVEGNRMRFDPARNQSFRYDGAWLASSSSALQACLLMPTMAAMNQNLV